MSQKRKETQETHSVNKKKKNLQEEDCNSELASNQKPEIKVEVEYDPLFENEADLTIRGSLEDIKLDIFDENVFVDALPKIKDLHCGKQNDISSSTNENKGSSPHQSVAVKKVIEKQREALKLFQAALMKFESVTKDLQEMVELDIIEAQTEADSRLQETEIIGTDKEVQISKENSSSSLAKSIRSKRNNNEEEFPTASSSLEKSNFINDDLDAVEASQTQESGDKGLERIKDPNSKQDTASDTSSEGQANSDVERNSPLPSTSYDRNSPIPSTSYDRNSPLPSTSYDRNSPVPSTSYDIGVVATCQNRQGKGKIKDSNLKENASSDVSFYPNNEMGPHSSSSSKIKSSFLSSVSSNYPEDLLSESDPLSSEISFDYDIVENKCFKSCPNSGTNELSSVSNNATLECYNDSLNSSVNTYNTIKNNNKNRKEICSKIDETKATSAIEYLENEEFIKHEITEWDDNCNESDYSPSTSCEKSPLKCKNILKTKHLTYIEIVNTDNQEQQEQLKEPTVQNIRNHGFRSRGNYCPYCLELNTHLPRHLTIKHKVEKKVQELISYPKSSKERALLLEELRKLGNFKHNSYVIKNNEGEILPTVRPKDETKAKDYVPCRNCLGFFPKNLLWRHNSKCRAIHKRSLQNKRIVGHGMNLLMNSNACSEQFMENVIAPMNCDDINLVVRSDLLILKFGETMYMKSSDAWKFRYARNAMRELGRFLIIYRKLDKAASSLKDVINPANFNNIVLATKELSGFDGENTFEHGSLAVKIGINIKKCAEILNGIALDENNEEIADACERFIKRFDGEWSNNISSLALRDIHRKRFNQPKYLPLVEDFQKLNNYISTNMKQIQKKLSTFEIGCNLLTAQKSEVQKLWKNLMELTLASIILFNKRSGEAERITVHYYKRSLEATSTSTDLPKTLSPTEQLLCKYFMRIGILGKKGNKVSVILSSTHVSCINLLLKFRSFIGVNPENEFLFPRSNSNSLNTISGPKALRHIVHEAELKKPEMMLSTSLRNHIATMSQILNLSHSELEELCKLMGLDIPNHTSFYQLSDDTVQLGKLTKLLIAMKNGDTLKYQNRTIEEIELDPEEIVSGDDDDDDDDDDEITDGNETKALKDDDIHEACLNENITETSNHKSCAAIGKRKPWTRLEKEKAIAHFQLFIKKQKLPGKQECLRFLKKYPLIFKERNWLHVKNFIRNKIVSLKRLDV